MIANSPVSPGENVRPRKRRSRPRERWRGMTRSSRDPVLCAHRHSSDWPDHGCGVGQDRWFPARRNVQPILRRHPTGAAVPEDIEALRFDQGLRGYRMDQVDGVLDALCERVRELESEVASLSVIGGTSMGGSHDLTNGPRG